jgi:ADP-ribose pyrophosphatase
MAQSPPTSNMKEERILPSVPAVRLQVIEDLTPAQPLGFLRLVRRRLVAIGPDGLVSAPFVYDEVDRLAIDAVVVAAYYLDEAARPYVYLRSATRPPISMRAPGAHAFAESGSRIGLWELVAGLVEAHESSPSGVTEGAKRELAEELGFDVDVSELRPLGQSTLPAPGVVAERHFYFFVQVDPCRRQEPSLDGSALEQLGIVVAVPLADALAACRAGEIEDAKTELGLRRLAELLESSV